MCWFLNALEKLRDWELEFVFGVDENQVLVM